MRVNPISVKSTSWGTKQDMCHTLDNFPRAQKLPVAFDESVDLATPDLQGVTGEWSDPRLVNTPDQAKGLTLDAIAVE